MSSENYDTVAGLYDLFGAKNDIGLFVHLAEERSGTCLELGVGTGRVALELARREIKVMGIDTSEEMLSIAAERLKQEPERVRRHLSLMKADMRSFDLGNGFDLVYSPAGGFQECLTEKEMEDCLRCIRRHLNPGGKIALAIWMPSLNRDYGVRKYEPARLDQAGRGVVRSIVWHRTEGKQNPSIDIFFQVYENKILTAEIRVDSVVNIVSADRIRGLLRREGFEISQELGDFESKEYQPGDEWMVVVGQ